MQIARAMEAGVKRVWPNAETVLVPVADGGDGTLQSLVDVSGGSVETATVTDPLGRQIQAEWGSMGDGVTAVPSEELDEVTEGFEARDFDGEPAPETGAGAARPADEPEGEIVIRRSRPDGEGAEQPVLPIPEEGPPPAEGDPDAAGEPAGEEDGVLMPDELFASPSEDETETEPSEPPPPPPV